MTTKRKYSHYPYSKDASPTYYDGTYYAPDNSSHKTEREANDYHRLMLSLESCKASSMVRYYAYTGFVSLTKERNTTSKTQWGYRGKDEVGTLQNVIATARVVFVGDIAYIYECFNALPW